MFIWNNQRRFVRMIVRWWWFGGLISLMVGVTAFGLTQGRQSMYVARATLMVGGSFMSAQPISTQLGIEATLAEFYRELALREPILRATQQSLGLDFSWQVLRNGMVAARIVPNANLLEITVTDSHPDRAAAIANTIGIQLIAYSPTSPEKIEHERQTIMRLLRLAEDRIAKLQKSNDQLTAQRDLVTSAVDLASLNEQQEQLNTAIEREQATYRSLLEYLQSSATNSLRFFERALPPTTSLPSARMWIIGLAALAGLLIACVAIWLFERLNNTWHDPDDLEDYFASPTLGAIPAVTAHAGTSDTLFQHTYTLRNIYTQILLKMTNQRPHTLLISSPQPTVDRTVFANALARLFVQSGCKVLIVDGDQVLLPTVTTATANLPVLPPSLRWSELIQHLRTTADIIIFDGPSVLQNADAAMLALHVDGIVLGLDPTIDTRADVVESITRLRRHTSAHFIGGVVLNFQEQQTFAFFRQWLRALWPRKFPPMKQHVTTHSLTVEAKPPSAAQSHLRDVLPDTAPAISPTQYDIDTNELLTALLNQSVTSSRLTVS